MKYIFENIIFTLALLCLLIGVSVWLLFLGLYFEVVPLLIVVVMLFVNIVTTYKSRANKINFMFNALECDDYSFSFPESDVSVNNIVFNALLNRVKELLVNAKQRTIEQEKYYEYIFDRLNIGVLILNTKGNILQANHEVREMLGVEVLGHINHITKISETLSHTISEGTDGEVYEVIVGSESGEKSFSVVASVARIGDEKLKIIAISRLDSALDRKEVEAWSKLTRVLTHEIMNSLSPITSLSETLLSMNNNPEMQQGLETIVQTNKSLISFVENYRSFTTVSKPVKHPFEIKPLLDNLLNLICSGNVDYSLSVDPEEAMLFADENQILQVVVNLLKNAVQAVENNQEKRIDVKVTIREDENILLQVTNNGPQISPEVVDNLFTPFFTTRKGGKGIGLSVSRQIMQLHNGSLTLTSNQPTKVTFTMLLK